MRRKLKKQIKRASKELNNKRNVFDPGEWEHDPHIFNRVRALRRMKGSFWKP